MHFYGTGKVNEQGHLAIGGVDTVALAEQYGTPLYIYDVALIRERAKLFRDTFRDLNVNAQVAYASKAFSSIAMFQLAMEEGLSLDVVSAGEDQAQNQKNSAEVQQNLLTALRILKPPGCGLLQILRVKKMHKCFSNG